MLEALANAWRVPDLRRKLMFTAMIIALYRLGAFVPLPGVDASALAGGGVDTQNSVTQLFGVFTGGAFNNLAVFSLGIMPYITAAIVMNLMTVAIPRLQELAREGDTGQAKITQYTRYFTLVLAFVQSIAMSLYFTRSEPFSAAMSGATAVDVFLMIVTLTAGVMLIMWMGEQISQRGLGNGISLIITASIIASAPSAIQALLRGDVGPLSLVVLGILLVIIVAAIVFVNEGQRRIPITYARRQVGRKMSQGGSTYLPLKVNMAGVIPIIFASSLLIFPTVLTQFASGGNQNSFLFQLAGFFGPPGQGNAGGVPYMILYAMLIIMFTYFYTAVQFNPIEHAENLKKSGGYVPGYRPGRPTAEYLNTVLTRITLFGAFFLATVAVLPYLITPILNLPSTIFIGGTSILIVVGVSLDTVRQLESQLMMRNYEGFLKSGR
jgi:preprotein translocase subunit SecY